MKIEMKTDMSVIDAATSDSMWLCLWYSVTVIPFVEICYYSEHWHTTLHVISHNLPLMSSKIDRLDRVLCVLLKTFMVQFLLSLEGNSGIRNSIQFLTLEV